MAGAKSKLRVVIATPLGPKGRGGMDRLTDLLLEMFKKHADLGIEVASLTTRGYRKFPSALLVFAYAVARIWYASWRGQVDLLHLNLAQGGSLYRKLILARIARRLNIPYVVHLHGSRFDEFWASASPLVQRAIGQLFSESSHIIVLGRFWERLITDHLPDAQKKITILPNATKSRSAKHERPKGSPVHICFLGLLGERKGTYDLIAALSQLKGCDKWQATIAGNGELDKCRAQVKSLGIAERVTIPGWLDSAMVEDLLSRTDIFVLPSTAENLPMAVLEAFAFGIAVVATPVGAVPEVIDHGRNGMIVPVGDVAALADALQLLIRDDALRELLGGAAKRDHADRYDAELYVERLAAIWRDAAETIGSDC
jgi:glycosyltransferase involved in cell wall biosynthesis